MHLLRLFQNIDIIIPFLNVHNNKTILLKRYDRYLRQSHPQPVHMPHMMQCGRANELANRPTSAKACKPCTCVCAGMYVVWGVGGGWQQADQ